MTDLSAAKTLIACHFDVFWDTDIYFTFLEFSSLLIFVITAKPPNTLPRIALTPILHCFELGLSMIENHFFFQFLIKLHNSKLHQDFDEQYSKTPEYTAPNCTDPDLTLFWIGPKNTPNTLIFQSYTVFIILIANSDWKM